MGLISPTQVSDGTTADASDVNNPINTIANEFNGNIDNSNIKTAAAISGSKLADNSIDLGAKTSTWDGWILVSDSWTYASASTITVPSDATTKYDVGDKIKLSNGSTKYFNITAVAATTLTVIGVSGEVVANSAITSVYYSKAETPHGFLAPSNPYKFSVYRSAAQALVATTETKIPFDTELFDTNNNFDSTTNYRYTAPVSGYYFLEGGIEVTVITPSVLYVVFYKNGSVLARGEDIRANCQSVHNSMLVQATAGDYFELYYYSSASGGSMASATNKSTRFNGFLVSRT